MTNRLNNFSHSKFSFAMKYVPFIFILMPHAFSNFGGFFFPLLKCACHFSITEDEKNSSPNTALVLGDLIWLISK